MNLSPGQRAWRKNVRRGQKRQEIERADDASWEAFAARSLPAARAAVVSKLKPTEAGAISDPCEFCGGETMGGRCANDGADWPHPPTVAQ